MNRKLRWLHPLLVFLLVLSSVLPYAASAKAAVNDVTVTVGSVTGKPGDIVEVPVSIDAPLEDITYYTIALNYDAANLEYVGVIDDRSELMGMLMEDENPGDGSDTFTWFIGTEQTITTSGSLFTLKLKINSNSDIKTYPISIDTDNSSLFGLYDMVNAAYNDGSVAVKSASTTNSVKWTAGTVSAVPGETVSVPVSISNLTKDIAAYGLTLTYDMSKLEAVDVTPVYGNASETCNETSDEGCFQSNFDNSAGTVSTIWVDSSGGDRPLTADYTGTLFTINFNVKESTSVGDTIISFDESASSDAWDPDFNPVIGTFTSGKITVVPTYTVTYDSNGSTGTVPTDDTKYKKDAAVTVKGNTGGLTKTGYTFAGWNTEANGTGASYAANDPFTIEAADVVLYAQWEANSYTVTFSGTKLSDATVSHGEKVDKPADPSKSGSIFGGWYADAEFDAEFDFTKEIISDTVIYAKWTVNEYKVTFNGTDLSDASITHGGKVTKPADPEKAGSTFGGWYADADFRNRI
ncbi:InlB B-repeat-containing protein [Domibacillus mangrovi]|uniref:Cohesin domain-containing protein n=1 Tax=Domibacillus mangrovi TaxID=1714354 RepID=A0A1Q5P1W8_9BACI|nr:InlB B-repeat-containing protein [Domibacillus mangrovi]OKL36237.1 hypothetical protein BLL40_10005 [Domibacillus mangrovi]